MTKLVIFQLTYREPRRIGTIPPDGSSFTYDRAHLSQLEATPVSKTFLGPYLRRM